MSRRAKTPPLPDSLIHGDKACRDRPSPQELYEFSLKMQYWRAEGRKAKDRPRPPPDWFDEDPSSVRGREARRICNQECPLTDECLDYTTQFPRSEQPQGIWGGQSQRERGATRRRR